MPRQEDTRRILVVEADESIGAVITDTLEEAGFAVQTARNATETLDALSWRSPDAILVDLAQPGEEGWAFLTRCRQQPGCAKLPIGIMSTTLAEDAAAGMARQRGYAWLPKPFGLDQLLTIVEDLTRARATAARLSLIERETAALVGRMGVVSAGRADCRPIGQPRDTASPPGHLRDGRGDSDPGHAGYVVSQTS